MSRVICVLGMHRSGTSMVSRLLNFLGIDLGPEETLRQADRFNPTGFWEQQRFIDFNDEILRRLGGTWRRLPRREAGWESSAEFNDLFAEASRFVSEKFAGRVCWGWKDPRTCLTLPFWQRVVPDLKYIVCLRNPVDVAHSLEHTMRFKKGGLLWLHYVSSSLMHTAGRERLFVFYEDCLSRLDEQMARLAGFVSLSSHRQNPVSEDRSVGFVDPRLEHYRTSPPAVLQERRLSFASKALYAALRMSVPGDASEADITPHLRDMIDALAYRSVEAHYRLLGIQARTSKQTMEIENATRLATHRETERARQQANLEQQLAVERVAREQSAAEGQRADGERRAEIAMLKTELEKREIALRRLRRRLRSRVEPADPDIERQLISLVKQIKARRVGSRRHKSPRKLKKPLDYTALVARIQLLAKAKLPSGSNALVLSKGDEQLVRLGPAVGRHFPYDQAGDYSGFHPKDSEAAIGALEAARADGAEFLIVPQTALWWLEHYEQFKNHLDQRYRLHWDDKVVCLIYDLRAGRSSVPHDASSLQAELGNEVRRNARGTFDVENGSGADQLADVVRGLLPDGAGVLVASRGDERLIRLCGGRHFPQGPDGDYVPPRDTATTIAQLETLAVAGAEYLVVPRSQFDWLEQDMRLTGYLRTHHRQIAVQPNVCTIFALRPKRRTTRSPVRRESSSNGTNAARRNVKASLGRKG